MIRRLLAFVALLGLGFSVLWFALGDEAFTATRSASTQTPTKSSDRSTMGGIDVQPDKEGTSRLTLSIQGAFDVQPTREIALADGSKLLLPTYRLHADDTRARPEADNLMEMRRVTVELFRLVRAGDEPRAEKSGELVADNVLVEIERDAHGRPSIHKDREMGFSDAVFRTLPGAGVTAMTLRVARARLRMSDTEAVLTTAAGEPFTLEFIGDQPATITGKGLLATIPSGDAPGPIDVRVLAEPRLITGDGRTTLSARGELRLREGRDQIGQLEVRDDVTMTFSLARDRQPMTARGDSLRAGMRRTRGEGGKPGALWQWLVLRGSPARVDAGQAQIDCERLDVLPSTTGAARLLTATGSPARVTLVSPDGKTAVLTSERRVHMLPLADTLHEWIGPLGFPRGALGPRFGQLIVFAGKSSAESEQAHGRLSMHASDGMVVLRSSTESMTSLRALGTVSAALPSDGPSEGVTLSGVDGLVLHDAPTADGRMTNLSLGIGRAAAPFFELRRGDALSLQGHGRCELRQTTKGALQSAEIEVTSASEDAVLRVPEGTLAALGSLRATLVGGAIEKMDASGRACTIDATLRDGLVRGQATTVHSDDGRSFRLRGQPAHVVDGQRGEVFGDRIDLMTFGGQSGLRARGNARVVATITRPDGTHLDIDLHGDVAEILPWRVPPAALRWHASFLPTPARVVCAAAWRAPHVHVRRHVDFTLTDPNDPLTKHAGSGDELWLAIEANGGRGLLLGQPAQARVAAKDQTATGTAESISFAQADRKLLVTLAPPVEREAALRLAAAGSEPAAANSGFGVRELTVYCRGQIRIEERQIRFLGPVRVLGDEQPDVEATLSVTADGMVMHRDASGAVTSIVADGHVDLASARVRGTADALTLDIKRALAVLRSQRGVATIVLDDGPRFTGSHVEFDYTTHAVRAWYGDVGLQEGR